MDPVNLNKFQVSPITTGKVILTPTPNQNQSTPAQGSDSFAEVLRRIQEGSEIQFSKHAAQRLSDRNISLDSAQVERLNEAVKLATDKGLRDTLVVMDNMTFIVNIPSNKVITTMNGAETVGNVFTNIDGAVII